MGEVDLSELRSLTPEQISALRPGTWDDDALLDVLDYFREYGDTARVAAVLEMLLHSPEHGETIYYDELYFEAVLDARASRDYPRALRWAYAALVYEEQRRNGENRDMLLPEIGELYLLDGKIDDGLALLSRCLDGEPADLGTYNTLIEVLPDVGLADLALEVLDVALTLSAANESEGYRKIWSDRRGEVQAEASRGKSRLPEVSPDVLANLRSTMQRASDHPGDPDSYLPPVDALIALQEDEIESTYEVVSAQSRVLAPDLIRMAFDQKLWGTPGPNHAVAILRRLAAEEAVELSELTLWLDRADGDWPRELLTQWAGKIGGFRTGELIAIASDAASDQFVRASMSNALVERVQKCPEEREQVLEGLRLLLTRPEAHEASEETFIGLLISDLEDMGAKELYPEIEAAFVEDRVDPTIIDLRSVQAAFGVPVSPYPKLQDDGFTLLLACKNCGRVRQHFVQHVMIDTLTQEKAAAGEEVKYDPLITDREIVCPKCGARDRYEMTSQAFMQLMVPAGRLANLAARLAGEEDAPGWKLDPRVQHAGSVAFGRPMHPLEALERYRRLINANPQDTKLYFRMGALLRTIRRYPQVLEVMRQGYEQGTSNPEFVLNRAMAEHDFGDREVAAELYQETLALLEEQRSDDPYYFELAKMARRGQRALERKNASPWQPFRWDGPPAPEKPAWQRKRKGRRPKKKRRRR